MWLNEDDLVYKACKPFILSKAEIQYLCDQNKNHFSHGDFNWKCIYQEQIIRAIKAWPLVMNDIVSYEYQKIVSQEMTLVAMTPSALAYLRFDPTNAKGPYEIALVFEDADSVCLFEYAQNQDGISSEHTKPISREQWMTIKHTVEDNRVNTDTYKPEQMLLDVVRLVYVNTFENSRLQYASKVLSKRILELLYETKSSYIRHYLEFQNDLDVNKLNEHVLNLAEIIQCGRFTDLTPLEL